jgi:acyl-CoA thioesterase-1
MAPSRLVVIGASVMAGFGLSDPRTLSLSLAAEASKSGVDLTIDNYSSAGATIQDGTRSLVRIFKADAAPDGVLITLGLGDAFFGVTPKRLAEHLDTLLHGVTSMAPAAQIYLVRQVLFQKRHFELLDDHARREWPLVFDEIGRRRGVITLPFFLRDVVGIPSLNQSDGLHPNDRGARAVARTLWADMQPTWPRTDRR